MKLSKEQKILVLLGAIIGILYFCLSITIALRFISFIFEKVSTKIIFILFGFPILISLGFIISAIGILYFKRWALRLYLISTIVVWLSSIKPLFLISYYSILGISEILLLVLSGVTLWFSLKKTTGEQFGLTYISAKQQKFKKFNRVFRYFFLILIIGIFSYYAISYFIIYPKQKIIYMPKDDVYLSSRYVKQDIFNFDLFLPKDIQIQSLNKMSLFWNKTYFLSMANPDGTVRMSINLDPTGDLYKYLGYRSNYEFQRRLNRFLHFIGQNFSKLTKEKIIARDIIAGKSLEGFLIKFPKNNQQLLYEYRLYDKNNKAITGNIHFLSAKNELTHGTIEDIIGSLKLRREPLRSAEEYFQEGLAFIDKSQYEEAKFSLVNALYQYWEDPKYNYYLGVAFLRTNNYNQAKYFLEKSISYLDAQILLEQIKDKFATETKNQNFGR